MNIDENISILNFFTAYFSQLEYVKFVHTTIGEYPLQIANVKTLECETVRWICSSPCCFKDVTTVHFREVKMDDNEFEFPKMENLRMDEYSIFACSLRWPMVALKKLCVDFDSNPYLAQASFFLNLKEKMPALRILVLRFATFPEGLYLFLKTRFLTKKHPQLRLLRIMIQESKSLPFYLEHVLTHRRTHPLRIEFVWDAKAQVTMQEIFEYD